MSTFYKNNDVGENVFITGLNAGGDFSTHRHSSKKLMRTLSKSKIRNSQRMLLHKRKQEELKRKILKLEVYK